MNVYNMVSSILSSLSPLKQPQELPMENAKEIGIHMKKRTLRDEKEEETKTTQKRRKKKQTVGNAALFDSPPPKTTPSLRRIQLTEPFKTSSFHYVDNKLNVTISNEKNRETWISSVDELHTLCNKAAELHYSKLGVEHFEEPLSRQYIVDRVSMDIPMRGFMARSGKNNELLGFITTTTFSTW
jgi:hypothetical protein